MKKFFGFALISAISIAILTATALAGGDQEGNNIWQPVDENRLTNRVDRPDSARYEVYRLNVKSLKTVFAAAPLEFTAEALENETILEVPTPDGKLVRFRIDESPMLAPEIAAKFPNWKTFQGRGIDDPTATARFDLNANGFHALVIGANGTFLIDPYSQNDRTNYIVYYKGGLSDSREPFACNIRNREEVETNFLDFIAPKAFSNGTQLRNYKLAVSATKQYTAFFGNNQTTAFAAIQTTVNRMIVVYRRELATTFTLVSDLRTVFTEANDGGFTNNSTQGLDRNQIVLDQTYGNANYDIGHVLSVTPNPDGLAASPSLCDPTGKAQGFTGAPTPQGDAFDVDYVAHEIGHQFSMSHTFNNDFDGSCTTRSADSAYEPASGVTIMGYAGICGPRNLSANSIEYFNLRSFDQSLDYMQTTIPAQYPTCGTLVATNNAPPANVSAGGNFNIPKQTPFTLTASATDANNDTLTYLWEEFDLGGATRSTAAVDTDEDGTARPIFRAYNPSSSPSRTFPSLYYILNNANVPPATYQGTLPFAPTTGSTNGYVCAAGQDCVTGERLPSVSRTMNFRVTVRDNNANGGGVADAQAVITVNAAAGPFVVTAQNTATTWAGNSAQTVTWDVAGTTANNINAANVRISLSTDGGQTFPTVLAASTANDGSEQITVPNVATTQARIKVEAVGNVFFDINNVNFTITASAPTTTVRSDFDGDGRTDFSVFRPSENVWYLNRSTSGFTAATFGAAGDRIVPADFDGDRKTDLAVWRPSDVPGQPDFFVLKSTDSTITGASWGVTTDVPVVADYDGDLKADYAVWRPSTGDFYVLQSQTGALRHYTFGANGDKPVSADYDGDGKADFAVFRPSTGIWYYAKSTDNTVVTTPWGVSTDVPVFADYDGDAKVDIAVFRPSDGTWYILRSTGGISYVPFGLATDVPAPGDYDGDGKYDQAVYRNGLWYVNNSTSGFAVANFGLMDDVAVPRNYLP